MAPAAGGSAIGLSVTGARGQSAFAGDDQIILRFANSDTVQFKQVNLEWWVSSGRAQTGRSLVTIGRKPPALRPH